MQRQKTDALRMLARGPSGDGRLRGADPRPDGSVARLAVPWQIRADNGSVAHIDVSVATDATGCCNSGTRAGRIDRQRQLRAGSHAAAVDADTKTLQCAKLLAHAIELSSERGSRGHSGCRVSMAGSVAA